MNKKIITFLQENTTFTLATSFNNIPYCAPCFYVFDEAENLLIFKSKIETTHVRQALNNISVAGTILPDKLQMTKICGIQFSGIFISCANEIIENLKKIYYRKYPFALAVAGEIWVIELMKIKFTDNTLGFGKKLYWERSITKSMSFNKKEA